MVHTNDWQKITRNKFILSQNEIRFPQISHKKSSLPGNMQCFQTLNTFLSFGWSSEIKITDTFILHVELTSRVSNFVEIRENQVWNL